MIAGIVSDFGMENNSEQRRALGIVADHFLNSDLDQLLLFVTGIGGSGKSHVIKAVVEMFKRCSVSDWLMLSAPTGCSAVLIDGYTIHALTFLPKT
ncbi:hypothetical protein BV22DRAFT_1020945, partial [Leucogyrophana mollusca]